MPAQVWYPLRQVSPTTRAGRIASGGEREGKPVHTGGRACPEGRWGPGAHQPKRSILIRSTGCPAATSSREACSAKEFEPHT
ncbi:hypothetical protein TPA0905_67720 [Streptomyces olivaceus]|nr:hypothetical protein TPA0905_67720 [Streptomyces olivaceus]